jgi:hypothetical protein
MFHFNSTLPQFLDNKIYFKASLSCFVSSHYVVYASARGVGSGKIEI